MFYIIAISRPGEPVKHIGQFASSGAADIWLRGNAIRAAMRGEVRAEYTIIPVDRVN